jgi:hypothetical protein
MYSEIATRFEGTKWANTAKQAMLDLGYAQLENVLKEGPGKLDKLLVQMKEIQEATSDKEFAGKINTWIDRLTKARKQGVELEFRRFRDEIEKLIKEGKFGEARIMVEKYPADKGLTVLPAQIKQYVEKTTSMAQIEKTAKEFYKAAFKKDWEKVAEFVDPEQVKKDQQVKSLQFLGSLVFGLARARDYRVVRIEVNLSEGTAKIEGKMTVNRRGLGGRTEEAQVPIQNDAVRRKNKWYIQLESKEGRRPDRDERNKPHIPKRPRRPVKK